MNLITFCALIDLVILHNYEIDTCMSPILSFLWRLFLSDIDRGPFMVDGSLLWMIFPGRFIK